VAILTFILSLLALLGIHSASPSPAEPSSGSIRVIARSCPAGVSPTAASPGACSVWVDGAAIQVTDVHGNAWGMNASRDDSLAGAPVIYSLDNLAFGTYTFGQPSLPAGFTSYVIAGAQLPPGGGAKITLETSRARAEITVYFLR